MLKQKVMDDLDALLADLQSTTSHISNYQSGTGGHRTPSPVDHDSILGGGIGHPPAASSTPIHGPVYAQVQPLRSQHQHSSTVVTVVNSVHGVTSNGKGSQGSSRESTPPPVPPHPSKEALEHLSNSINPEPLYETQAIKQHQKTFNNNTSSHHVAQVTAAVGRQYVSTDGAPQPHQGIPVSSGMALPQPRSPSTNSMQGGPKSPPPVAPKPTNSSSLSANLSELDILLQDLSSAQFLEEVDRKNAVNHPSGSVSQPGTMGSPRPPAAADSLQTNGYGNYIQESHYEMIRPTPANQSAPSTLSSGATMPTNLQTPSQRAAAASSATRELEELMNSLSEFRVTEPPPVQSPEAQYSQPNKQKLSPVIPYPQQPGQDFADGAATVTYSTSQGIPAAQHAATTPNSAETPLETMLGDLNSDMTRQGIMTIPKGHCAACMKPIVGQVITALGKIWHPEHFNCAQCKQELGTQNFYEREGLPYCEPDYHQLFSPKCAHCQGPILDKCVTALDQTWHPEHFVCYTCHRPFSEEGFHEKDGKAFCRDDYFDNFSPKCGGCGRAIMDNYISALNRQWHPECFVCMECLRPFGTGSFYDHEGLPYCETHYHARRGSLCAGCHKPITGRCITAMYKKFHPEHFVCAFCLKQLNKGTFKEQNDKPYCHPCFVKLFG